MNVLVWVVHAKRSLAIEELRYATSVNATTFKLERKRVGPQETLISVCCGLVVIEQETGLVRLIRRSPREISIK